MVDEETWRRVEGIEGAEELKGFTGKVPVWRLGSGAGGSLSEKKGSFESESGRMATQFEDDGSTQLLPKVSSGNCDRQ